MNAEHSIPQAGTPFVCSWSGGKDSCLALYRAASAGARPKFLLTMLQEDGKRSRSHGLARDVLQAQALALGIPLLTRATSWDEYEAVFVAALQGLSEAGIEAGVFGDIDIEDHRLWEEKVCGAAGIGAYLPLWKTPRLELFDEFLSRGFEAVIVAVCEEKLDKAYLGETLSVELAREFDRLGIDPAGEEGEYHTVVTNGPIFSRPLRLEVGEQVFRSGYWFLDLCVV
ncbi:MAG TPA: diphthine--ammonia ligase [Thermoflexia bacterium]|nr:diphthine--ammonia ligase [Thermoflexia bacterium]